MSNQHTSSIAANPDFLQLANGGLKITTPPFPPRIVFEDDGQLVEYVFPFPIYLEDAGTWPPVRINVGGKTAQIQKPIAACLSVPLQQTLGNDSMALHYTIVRAFVPHPPIPEYLIYQQLVKCLEWLRILGRQYWIFHGSIGRSPFCNAACFETNSARHSQTNIVHAGQTVIIKPLTKTVWESIEQQISANCVLPVAESIYCDALISTSLQDDVKALTELGMAAEIELTQLHEDILPTADPHDASEYAKQQKKNGDRFEWKFKDGSQLLKMSDAGQFVPIDGPSGWSSDLLALYRSRNKAIHLGRAIVVDKATKSESNMNRGEFIPYIFAMEAFFSWIQENRTSRSLERYKYPWLEYRQKPLNCVIGDHTDSESSIQRPVPRDR